MNSTITFTDKATFETALNALALYSTPPYDAFEADLTISSQDINGIIDVLASAGVEGFNTKHTDTEPSDGFLTDAEADADALSSAGWGTNEDYGHYGYDE